MFYLMTKFEDSWEKKRIEVAFRFGEEVEDHCYLLLILPLYLILNEFDI